MAEGATVLCGGRRASDEALAAGFYMQPTVLGGIDPRRDLAHRAVRPGHGALQGGGFEEALALVNNSPYGLTASIHTSNIDRALAFAEEARRASPW